MRLPVAGSSAILRFLVLGWTIGSSLGITRSILDGKSKTTRTPMHKVQLTQKGYIQFLRWELPVPEFKEFTFCLWLRSNDLTHSHSIFSYSKNERDRLARSWISPHGRTVHLEIAETEVFSAAIDLTENRWYHICESWEGKGGRYALWIDGRLRVQGTSEETRNRSIPPGGDIVLGQEYTDFDKGLEEGIEGAVFGFNLLLASSFGPARERHEEAGPDSVSSYSNFAAVPFLARIPLHIMHRGVDYRGTRLPRAYFAISRLRRTIDVSSGTGRKIDTEFLRPFLPERTNTSVLPERRRSRREVSWGPEPLGLRLVKESFVRCEVGRGSPYVGGSLLLISWSRTPVRVFGGATLKNVEGGCGNF